MIDFSVFDSILDSIFVIDGEGRIQYCNDAAATFCQTSVRRVAGKAMMIDVIQFVEPGLLPFTPESQGRSAPTPFIETAYSLPKVGKAGKVQLAIRPIDENHWGVFIKDVSLEETLAAKYRQELAKTEEYARNLEKLVEARTSELRIVNQTLNAILNSLGQGFFTFNPAGECGSVFTKACEEILEGIPRDRKAWQVLGVPQREIDQFQKWMESSFKEFLPFDDLRGLGPNLYPHSQNKYVVLEYYPIRREANRISDIVVVATDKTTEHQAQLDLESERQYAAMVVKYLKNKDQFLQFLESVRVSVDRLLAMEGAPLESEGVNESFRILHTLEGEAGTFSLRDLRQSSRETQHILEPFKSAGRVPSEAQVVYFNSLRALQKKFESFLKENESIFQLSKAESRSVEVPAQSLVEFSRALDRSGTPPQLKAHFAELFLKTPIESRLKYFDSLVQSVAERLGKQVHPLVIEGGDLKIFPEPYQPFFSALVHAFRNAIDHGLEEPTEREWAGKSPAGTVRVQILPSPEGGFKMKISDDGKGIDPSIIREKLKEKFPGRDFSSQTDEEIIQNVCLPGFSSRESVGEFSGRGVGLDALREEVLNLGGSIHLSSKLGEGTSIEVFVPDLGMGSSVLRSA